MNFGNRLLNLRKKKNISQETLADKIGVTRQTISNWEMNITTPSIVDLINIANVLEINYNELLDESNIKKENENNKEKDINSDARTVLKIFKIIGIIFIMGIIVTLILLTISKVNYDTTNVIGGNSIRCIYNDSSYIYNIDYNKKHQVVKVEINGQEFEKNMNDKWIDELNSFVTSKKITNSNTLISYIIQKYKENNGHCS